MSAPVAVCLIAVAALGGFVVGLVFAVHLIATVMARLASADTVTIADAGENRTEGGKDAKD